MKKLNFIILILTFCLGTNTYGQNSLTITFSGINGTTYFQLDSIKVKNLSQGGDTVLYYPDTILLLNYVGIGENPGSPKHFRVLQNYPNPVTDRTTISLLVPEKDMVNITVSDILGRHLITTKRILEKGYHSFIFTPSGDEIYLFTARWRGDGNTIRVLNMGHFPGRPGALEYLGQAGDCAPVKHVAASMDLPFNSGDELMFIGYGGTFVSGFIDAPEGDMEFVFQFATNIPCPGLDSLQYEGQWYHTIQIFSQCWMKENLNAGARISSSMPQLNNSIIEKYCMGDDEEYCDIFGGLYFWDEMMDYTYANRGQGICPAGWHIPGDYDWQVLEGAVDSESGIGASEWEGTGWRGTDAGGNLKQEGTELWENPNTGATDSFGFSAVPGGYYVQNAFWGPGYKCYLWSSDPEGKYYRNMDWNQAMINRNITTGGPNVAVSVRCIKD